MSSASKSLLLLLCLCLVFSFKVIGSRSIVDTSSNPIKKWSAGYYLNPLSESKNNFNIEFSPFVGYSPIKRLLIGLGPVYVFEKRLNNLNKSIQFNTFGGRVFFQYNITKEIHPWIGKIVLTSETELLDRKYLSIDNTTIQRDWMFNSFIGPGLKTDFSKRDDMMEVFFLLQYNYLYNKKDAHKYYEGSPLVFRLGFLF
jgi:hypothetical protein